MKQSYTNDRVRNPQSFSPHNVLLVRARSGKWCHLAYFFFRGLHLFIYEVFFCPCNQYMFTSLTIIDIYIYIQIYIYHPINFILFKQNFIYTKYYMRIRNSTNMDFHFMCIVLMTYSLTYVQQLLKTFFHHVGHRFSQCWNVTPCQLVNYYQYFERPQCLQTMKVLQSSKRW